MDFFEAVQQRVSVREYRDAPIARQDMEKIIDAARQAPTARGEQPWEFIIVENKQSLRRLAGITDHGRFLAGAAAAVVVISKETKYYLEDCCAATENILLAATALGIGSCWIAGDKKQYAGEILAHCGVGPGYKLVSIIALGYPKEPAQAREKRPLAGLMHRENFGKRSA